MEMGNRNTYTISLYRLLYIQYVIYLQEQVLRLHARSSLLLPAHKFPEQFRYLLCTPAPQVMLHSSQFVQPDQEALKS